MSTTADPLAIARAAFRRLRADSAPARSQCEESEESEESPPSGSVPADGADPFVRWRLRNAGRLTSADLGLGHDPGGNCAEHRRPLSYPEQKRGACSWCVGVDPEREPEYWASHWRRFSEKS
jgi:hypothetical protein